MDSSCSQYPLSREKSYGQTPESHQRRFPHDDAGIRERSEIGKLERPLNTAGPVAAWSDPLANESRIAIMRNYHKRIEHDSPEDPS